jgi:Zn-finger nucleic acid-binding protein
VNGAAVYRCPSCGAPADPKSPKCSFCGAELHAVRCPWCFDWSDAGAGECPRCGAAAAAPASPGPVHCPSCRGRELFTRALGGARLSGCPGCGGVWADADSFKKLCEDRSTQAAYMGEGTPLAAPKPSDPSQGGILYRPCAVCGELMNRFNFADCSGVILDACKPHGVWFDADELRRIVAFIRAGGLDLARRRQIQSLELERRRLEQAREDAFFPPGLAPSNAPHVASAAGLLAQLFGSTD